jgi:hypothetical protein
MTLATCIRNVHGSNSDWDTKYLEWGVSWFPLIPSTTGTFGNFILPTIGSLPATNLLSPRSRVLFEKLTSAQLVKKFSYCVETDGSLPLSQEPSTGPYHGPHKSGPWPTFYFLKTHFDIGLPSTLRSFKCSPSIRLPHKSVVCTSLVSRPCSMPHLPLLFFLVWSLE